MAEFDFASAAVDEVLAAFFADGCVLLRNCVEKPPLAELQGIVDQILDATGQLHFFDWQARQKGGPHFYQYVFTAKHLGMLRAIFGEVCRLAQETLTRRIDPAVRDAGWQAPLAPHLDAFFHQFRFTVNFWVPFRRCGRYTPSLAVVRAPFAEAVPANLSGMMANPPITADPIDGTPQTSPLIDADPAKLPPMAA